MAPMPPKKDTAAPAAGASSESGRTQKVSSNKNSSKKKGPWPGTSPENGDHPVVMSSGVAFTPSAWQGKYWRIGNRFYDLTPFLDRHPGGRALLEMARDRFDDSTYAFEAHHHNQAKVRKMLDLYEVKGVTPPQSNDSNRTFPNLMPEDSFFSDFRRRTTKWLADNYDGDWGPTRQCLQLFWTFSALWAVSCYFAIFRGYILACVFTGLFGAVLGGFGHSFIHQPKYKLHALSLDLLGFSSHCWFREHLLQHHMWTNTPLDNHFHGTEPFLRTDPTMERHWLQKYVTPQINFVLISFGAFVNYAAHLGSLLKGEEDFHIGKIFLPIQVFLYFYFYGFGSGLLRAYIHFGVASVWYFTIALLNHNTLTTTNVAAKNDAVDWGHAQLLASSDIDVGSTFLGSIRYLWLNFHTVHHLLPHTDMSKHPGLQRVLLETIKDHPEVKYDVRPFSALYSEMMTSLSTPQSLGEEVQLYAGRHHAFQ